MANFAEGKEAVGLLEGRSCFHRRGNLVLQPAIHYTRPDIDNWHLQGRSISTTMLLWVIGAEMATFILIPGGWQGGWVFEKVTNLLIARGHKAKALTLAGLGEVPAPATNLASHIDEAVQAIWESSGDLILVGQSYGGMVITGAADVEPAKIRALVYADAYVPQSGESVWSLTSPRFREAFITGAKADGLNCAPPPNLDPRCRPHPMGTFLQAIDLSGHWRQVSRKTYVGAHGWEGSPFLDLYKRLSVDPEWETVSLDCGHNIARLQPEALTEILLAQV
jgi:pimeloyl-ACP methyl ester carboxylesterase